MGILVLDSNWPIHCELLTVDGEGCDSDTQRSAPGRPPGGRALGRRSVEVTKATLCDVSVFVAELVAVARVHAP